MKHAVLGHWIKVFLATLLRLRAGTTLMYSKCVRSWNAALERRSWPAEDGVEKATKLMRTFSSLIRVAMVTIAVVLTEL